VSEVISTDWDDTMALWKRGEPVAGGILVPPKEFVWNERLIKELKELQDLGCEIHVTTYRGSDTKFGGGFGEDLDVHLPVLKSKFGLEIRDIHYTNGTCKSIVLRRIAATRHYDDCDVVCCRVALFSDTEPIYVGNGHKNSVLTGLIANDRVRVWEGNKERPT
jgi:hypothetical protein